MEKGLTQIQGKCDERTTVLAEPVVATTSHKCSELPKKTKKGL